MSDRMECIAFDKLINWCLEEYKLSKSIFGITNKKFYKKELISTRLKLFDNNLEMPIGPAAGPHTQLAQNIITAYLTGCRFFELKTVQKIDGEDLPVSKPCILASDEGYNVEWSTELTVPDALNEYIKAWFALNVLAKEYDLGQTDGFIFNMSVGYDLEGIMSEKIDRFIESLKDASNTLIWKECIAFLTANVGKFEKVDISLIENISPQICNSITLSTLHGCKPEEIERISMYLLNQKGLNTFVKCNPTLLGYKFVRDTLDKMGYDYISFDDHHFNNDLQFEDAVNMIKRLKKAAKDLNREFGVKLTNTFPVKIENKELPGEEMYMSGRALYPLSLNLAYKLAKEFDGDLKISYSGGADYFNIDKIINTGIWPVTIATTVLKPGGYKRFTQIAHLLDKTIEEVDFTCVDVKKLENLIKTIENDDYYNKESQNVKQEKLKENVPLFDCFTAPCTYGCPINQDIPQYMKLVSQENYVEALKVIVDKNPLPHITGTLCSHMCMSGCNRAFYDSSANIRSTKLTAAQKGFEELIKTIKTPDIVHNTKVAVIGAGPAGLSAAYFIAKNGIEVTVFDKGNKVGGVISKVIPNFRILKQDFDRDIELISKMGVKFELNYKQDFSLDELKKQGYKYIFAAIGAWNEGILKLEECDKIPLNVLQFLKQYNNNPDDLILGKKVAVIGAGNSAIDAARTAKRVKGVEKVFIIYRRTKKYMPADLEEFKHALDEGIEFKELLAPASFKDGVLTCQKMELGAPDLSGRRRPIAIDGMFEEIKIDTIISAIGEKVDKSILIQNGIEFDDDGCLKVDKLTNETSIENVFIGGDALRGPATIVEAIADGTKAANAIVSKIAGEKVKNEVKEVFITDDERLEILNRRGVLKKTQHKMDMECLLCNHVCEICTEVCPNRANISVHQRYGNKIRTQIIHIDGMCNECGNCETFCPYSSAPYKDKLTLYWNIKDFEESKNSGFVLIDESKRHFRLRLGDEIKDIEFDENGIYNGYETDITKLLWTVYKDYNYLFKCYIS